jgi:universal stress protein A
MGYRHILAAVDFSETAGHAAARAARLARQDAARLTLLHVVEFFPEDLPLRYIAPENVDPAAYLEAHARRELDALLSRLGVEDADRLVVLSAHSARHEIPRLAAEQGADLIVVGTHGRRGGGQHLGSTAVSLVHHAACDVLAVRAAP